MPIKIAKRSDSHPLSEGANLATRKIIAVDVARGCAALFVFIYHYNVGNVFTKYTGLKIFEWLNYPGAMLAVPLFFLVSGFCIHLPQARSPHSELNLLAYLRRRFWRIYPPYLVALLFSCAICAINAERVDLFDFGVHVFLLQGYLDSSFNTINVVLWTISIEMSLYLIYPIWLFIRKKWGLATAFSIGVSISLASGFTTFFVFRANTNVAQWFVLNVWAGWLLGAVVAEMWTRRPSVLRKASWWVGGICCYFAFFMASRFGLFERHGAIYIRPVLILLSAWPFVALLNLEPVLKEVRRGVSAGVLRVMIGIGASSYSLYLLHSPLINLRNAMGFGSQGGQIAELAFWTLSFILILVTAFAAYLIFEKPFVLAGRQERGV